MVHIQTEKAITCYVLDTSMSRLAECPPPNKEQKEQIAKLASEVDKCADDIFKELSKNSTFTLKTNLYNDLFPVVYNEKNALKWVFLELAARGIQLEESSSEIHRNRYSGTEYILIVKKSEEKNSSS
jgi:hypothetical protein